jgi:hypothetical protein
MVRHGRRLALCVSLILLHVGVVGSEAAADSHPVWGGTFVPAPPSVTTGEWQVDVRLRLIGGDLRAGWTGGGAGGGGGSGPSCELTVVRMPTLDAVGMPEGVFEGAIPVQIRCGQAVVDERWTAPGEVIDIDAEAAAAARQYVESVLGPSLSMETSPPANILVGLSTWFWMDGWDGQPINTSVVAPWGEAIDLELSLDHVVWDFGDGSPPEQGDLGQAHPATSSVQHVYTDRSTSRAAPDGAYEASAQVHLNVRYWYEGEGPFSVPALVHTHTAPVVVRQLQAVIG